MRLVKAWQAIWCDVAVPSEQDSFAKFKAAAENYIRVVQSAAQPVPQETSGEGPREDLLADLADALSTLYNRALHLPQVWDDAWTFEGEREFTGQEASRRAVIPSELSERLREIDFYWTVVAFGKKDAVYENPGSLSEALSGHMLCDDLGDIYWGLQDGFDLLRAGGPEGEATYRWRFGFWNHWGEHAVNALRIIHARLPEASTLIGSKD